MNDFHPGIIFNASITILISGGFIYFSRRTLSKHWRYLKEGSKSLYDVFAVLCSIFLLFGVLMILVMYFASLFFGISIFDL